ncbi:MAG TPA: malto-oligosyltrehalose synthase [Terriglobales bacterium]|nr:malto-oligosyltrehalose synthase [Terriglobales bacterium]
MRSSSLASVLESSGYSECLDRLAATGGEIRPLATYRFQFNAGFRLEQARQLVPYLERLGITHIYASPLLQARAGSLHGYDITDHNYLNPEIGSMDDFRALAGDLKSRGMGLVLDIVPNHVAVTENNPWWRDVLENGRASEFANYFDIDWYPLKTELRGKLLLPILGDQYGEELEQSRLRLAYDEEQAGFVVQYYEKRLPIDPQTIPLVFNQAAQYAPTPPPNEAGLAFRALITEFGCLPPHSTTDPVQAQQRRELVPELRNKLRGLLNHDVSLRQYVDEVLARCNGVPGNSRSFDSLHRLLEAQAYRLAHWRVSAEEINYRRFFDVNDLVGLRMENPSVFAATHRLVRRFLAEGLINGLRVDHPDGLLNPHQYFTRLQMLYAAGHCCGPEPRPPLAENGIEAEFQDVFGQQEWLRHKPPLYVAVEKILEPGEELAREWMVDGTVGYDFANLVNGIFIDPRGERPLTNTYHRFTGESDVPAEIVYNSKKLILNTALPSEVNVLTHMLEEICNTDRRARDFTRNSLHGVVEELIACFPVYRSYIDERGNISENDRRTIMLATARAKRRNEGVPSAVFDFVRDILLLKGPKDSPADAHRQRLHFTLKFQQLTGPVMAKGLEDTACYSYNRFVALNEVGGSPQKFGTTLEEFHQANVLRGEYWPNSMLATSTHDTKRSEDVRARLDVISEMPRAWSLQVMRWRRMNRTRKSTIADGRSVPDANEEYLLYQTLAGALPFALMQPMSQLSDTAQHEEFVGRIQEYMNKAVHEAKRNLSWVNSNPEYVEALRNFISRILHKAPRHASQFWDSLVEFASSVAYFGAINSLAQTLLKITAPGLPDIYQGNEIWDFSLVDPDNRRPVDFTVRERFLDQLLHNSHTGDLPALCAELLQSYPDGRVKLWTTLRALNFRREHSELFRRGLYHPLEVSGSKRVHLCAFARISGNADEMVVAAVPRLSFTLMKGALRPPLGEVWQETELQLPRSAPTYFVDAFTGKVLQTDARRVLSCSEVFAAFPVALLVGR